MNSVRCEGMIIVSASSDSTVKVWDLRTPSYLVKTLTGKSIPLIHLFPLITTFSPSVLLIVSCSLCSLATGHVGEVKCCYLANDRLVSGGEDRLVRVWDIGTGRACQRFDHTYPVSIPSIRPLSYFSSLPPSLLGKLM